jgi:hypothetical protein
MQKIYKIISAISLLLIACLLFAVLIFSRGRIICIWDIDEAKLNSLAVAITLYVDDYGELPPEADFKRVLLEHNYIDKEDVFYSSHKENMLLRYYQDGDSYVLVAPGKNKTFDTPEGYKNIRDFCVKSKKKTDDIIHFSHKSVK